MRNKFLLASISLLFLGCNYSFTGASTNANSITVDNFFNNTDLGPANLGATFTNNLKDYYQRNSSLNVISSGGQLYIEGTISEYRINPIAPVATGIDQPNSAALTRLTISIRVSYDDTLDPKNSFKDRTFSFYQDFPNDQDFTSIQEDLEKRIFEQILIDIFNATIANW